ncbi:nicotinic acid mononucleotide adenyltransferase [Xanthomarina sp. F2636L]|uniref:nicotinic acid mononucleotide adenyltransferase n=1 Tax=Xanthomarina sp. F2636L TaxID=2996018 RepID=UPI00225DDB9B|nr:nicotinic acid mononucleotide adenyltransferase [Xanthomarina sp. F2636L]MCX7551162.1 nicotinic acid mononucleotide adenyltransferase [Xanthomarina sp. F2636L]
MKTLKLLLGFALVASLFTSCYTDDVYINNNNPQPSISLNQLLSSYELWYVDINETIGYGQVPFLQMAFTMSFKNGTLWANNNLVGIGTQGNGFGIPVGDYDAYNTILDVYHVIDGFVTFDVYQINANTIELYDPYSDTSYFLKGYQRANFDYDYVFYDNIHYFLQEYEAWEKTYTSPTGDINEFDNENYLQFLAGGNDSEFRSSQDYGIVNPENIFWDYTGIYGVNNIPSNMYLKTLVLNYDYYGSEFFELSVINDGRIRLFHTSSGTTYEFTGRGYIQFMKTTEGKQSETPKMRKFKNERKENPRENSRV